MTLDDVKARLDKLDARLGRLETSADDLLKSVVALQRFGLRAIGAAVLVGSCVVYVIAHAAGLG